MDCYCSSKSLYSDEKSNFLLQSITSPISTQRSPISPMKNPLKSPNLSHFQKAFEISSISFSPSIQRISLYEIQSNPLFFYREFVSKNFPCIITNAIDTWEALDSWQDPSYLITQLNNKEITVDLTPDGFADSIKNQYFIEPYQKTMNMKEFLNIKENFNDSIGYIQKQNDNLNSEFSYFLQKDVDISLKDYFGKHIFNKSADACNFWMGQNPSVSSLHKDHYENIYAVITGEKHFTLIPPVCYPCLYEGQYTRARWDYDNQKHHFFVKKTDDMTNWLTINPDLESDRKEFIGLSEEDLGCQYHVVIQAGEVLYLPSLWFHQVSQFNGKMGGYTTAVNFWFDMEFGNNFALFETLKGLI